jgi:hypothetical protein
MLKSQFRKREFFIPFLFIILIFFTDNFIIIFIVLQNRFTGVFENSDFNLKLFHTAGKSLSRYLQIYNLSWATWFNLWFICSKFIDIILLEKKVYFAFMDVINFNIILFFSFIIGNIISNSNIVTISKAIFRFAGSALVFGIIISIIYAIVYAITLYEIAIINIIVLFTIVLGWNYSIKQQIQINFIDYYFD